MSILHQAKQYYEVNFLSQFGCPKGSSVEEITSLEDKMNVKFPEAYKQFLLWMGNDIDGVFKGSEWFLKDIEENSSTLDELLSDNDIECVHRTIPICFFMHQGYMAGWFYNLSDYVDPICFFFSEGNDERGVILEDSISSFVFNELKGLSV